MCIHVSSWGGEMRGYIRSYWRWYGFTATLSGREACGRTLTKRTRASFKRAFFHVDAIHSASRATMAAAAEQLAAELKRVDHPLYVIEGLVRCPFILLLLWATCKRLVVSQALTG